MTAFREANVSYGHLTGRSGNSNRLNNNAGGEKIGWAFQFTLFCYVTCTTADVCVMASEKQTMHNNDKKQKFIELRVKGESLSSIAKTLDVSKTTLWRWDQEEADRINELQLLEQDELESLWRLERTDCLIDLKVCSGFVHDALVKKLGERVDHLPIKDLFLYQNLIRSEMDNYRVKRFQPPKGEPRQRNRTDSPAPQDSQLPTNILDLTSNQSSSKEDLSSEALAEEAQPSTDPKTEQNGTISPQNGTTTPQPIPNPVLPDSINLAPSSNTNRPPTPSHPSPNASAKQDQPSDNILARATEYLSTLSTSGSLGAGQKECTVVQAARPSALGEARVSQPSTNNKTEQNGTISAQNGTTNPPLNTNSQNFNPEPSTTPKAHPERIIGGKIDPNKTIGRNPRPSNQ